MAVAYSNYQASVCGLHRRKVRDSVVWNSLESMYRGRHTSVRISDVY